MAQKFNKLPMQKLIGVTEVRNHLGSLINRVFRGEEHLVIEKLGIPVAALISMKDYEQYRHYLAQQLHRDLGRKLGAEVEKQGLTEEELIASAVWCVLSLLLVMVVSLVLAGCAQQDQAQTQTEAHAAAPPSVPTAPGTMTTTVTAITTQTGTPAPEGTGTPNNITAVVATHEAFETGVTDHRQQIQTEVALTHEPTTTPGQPAQEPSPTPQLGMLAGCGNANAYGPQGISCWRGVIDGELVDVDAGREGLDGDATQGIVQVHVWGQEEQQDDIYQTPDRVGAVSITSVNGMLFTLTTVSQPTPQVFVFDLANRRWVSP